ncbi:hypothetical protein ACIPSA_30650 [Streptomyces sp. NPDC086549]|uniref:hypothetical protein n=1 Tax=Streptomyces sp. NPDC086549 TaxID=3365752 RepID=UPI003804861F
MAQTPDRLSNPPRHTPTGHVSPNSPAAGELPTRADRERPTGTQVWSWAGTAVLFGYGPAASSLV